MKRPRRLACGARNGAHTHPERIPRGERHGRYTKPERTARGERQWCAKLTESGVLEIRRLWGEGATIAALAQRFGVAEGTIAFVVRRETWAHVP